MSVGFTKDFLIKQQKPFLYQVILVGWAMLFQQALLTPKPTKWGIKVCSVCRMDRPTWWLTIFEKQDLLYQLCSSWASNDNVHFPNPVILNQGQLHTAGDIWQHLGTLLIITTGGGGATESSGRGPGLLLNILHCTRQPLTTKNSLVKNVSSAKFRYLRAWKQARPGGRRETGLYSVSLCKFLPRLGRQATTPLPPPPVQ